MRIVLAALAVFFWALPAHAAEPAVLEEFDRTVEKILESRYETTGGLQFGEVARLRYGAYNTFSGLAVDNDLGETRVLRQADSRLWAHAQLQGHTFYGRLRIRYRDFNTGDGFTNSHDGLTAPIGDRYWYQFDWRGDQRAEGQGDPDWNWGAKLGRQYVFWASGLALAKPLYAARAYADVRAWHIDLMWATTPRNGFIDFDGSRPGAVSDTARDFWGVLVEYRGFSSARPYVYVLHQYDENDQPGFAYDSTYIAIGSVGQVNGEILYRFEYLLERGDSGSDLFGFPVTTEDIDAWAARFEIVWTPIATRHTTALRFEFELLLASGDDDRAFNTSNTVGGNRTGTDDEAYNAFGYARLGLALDPELSNLISARFTGAMRPLSHRDLFERMEVRLDVFLFNKMDDDAPNDFPSEPGEGYLGTEIDIAVQWHIFSDASIDVRYGIFIPDGAFFDSDPHHFFFAGFSHGF